MKWLPSVISAGERPRDPETQKRLEEAVERLERNIDRLSELVDDHEEGRLGDDQRR